jgi:hypothetical protein
MHLLDLLQVFWLVNIHGYPLIVLKFHIILLISHVPVYLAFLAIVKVGIGV